MGTYDRTKVDDAAFTPGTDDVYPIGAMADESSPDSVDEGDVGIPRMTLDRKLLTRVVGSTDANRLEVSAAGAASENLAQVAGNSVTAGAGSVAAGTQRVTLASDDPAVASLGIIDDWDESDRAKVNPIVGQAGVQGGSGTTNALTQRVVLATDVALPTGTNSIGDIANITTSVTPGTGAGNLGKAEAASFSSGDTGVLGLTVRNDSGAYASIPSDVDGNISKMFVPVGGYVNDGSPTTIPMRLLATATQMPAPGFNSVCVIQDYVAMDVGIPLTTTGTFGTSGDILGAVRSVSLTVIANGPVTSWTVLLEGTIDGTNWGTLAQHTNATGSGQFAFAQIGPVKKARFNCTALVLGLGTNIVAVATLG